MTAFLVFDQNNKLRSIGTVLAQLPTGWTTTSLSDADFTAIRHGDKIVDEPTKTVVANPAAAGRVNQDAIGPLLVQALARLDQIIGAAPATFANIGQAQAAFQQLQVAVQDEARMLRRLVRLATNTLDGTD